MRQLQFTALGEPRLVEVPAPTVAPGRLLLRTRLSALSNGTERAQMLGETYNLRRQFPLRPGYQAISTVEAVGEGVRRFAPGDLVYSATFGTHAELHGAAEDDLLVRLPADGCRSDLAFLAVAAVAWNDVGLVAPRPGERLLVVGAGPIGQYAVQAARVLGAAVTLASRGRRRLEAAAATGAVALVETADTRDPRLLAAGPFHAVAECSGADNLDGILGEGFGSPRLLIPRGGRLVLVAGRDRVAYSCNAAQGGAVSIHH